VLPTLSPIPLKERISVVWVERGRLDMLDGAFVVVDKTGVRTHIPVGNVGCIMLEPGSRVSHAAVALAARVGCLLQWVGEGGVRLYAAGQPGGARSDKLLYQASLALDPKLRLKVVRKMYAMRFGEEPPEKRSVEQLRGMEAARVRRMYQHLSSRFGIRWTGRRYDPTHWEAGDLVNKCLSAATASLYGITEAAILAAGYAPAIGFLHWGKPRSFVYDIADLFKFETVAPVAFETASRNPDNPERAVRIKCRDAFRRTRMVERVIPTIEEVLAAGGVEPPKAPPEALPVAIPEGERTGDAGHRG
jgi:CRISPR-associated protein Cas1